MRLFVLLIIINWLILLLELINILKIELNSGIVRVIRLLNWYYQSGKLVLAARMLFCYCGNTTGQVFVVNW